MSLAPFYTEDVGYVSTPSTEEAIIPGDIVAVQHGAYGRQEGLVVGKYTDTMGRQVVEVQLDGRAEVYGALYPTVTRVRRTAYYRQPATVRRSVERRVYW